MDRDVEPAPAAYLNRPTGHASSVWRSHVENLSRLRTTGRAVDRMLLVLRAHEQRAQRRAALRTWMLGRQRGDPSDSRGLTAMTDPANG
jgi:hypothetical protein